MVSHCLFYDRDVIYGDIVAQLTVIEHEITTKEVIHLRISAFLVTLSRGTFHLGIIIGASLSEPHIVVISITFSCPTVPLRLSVDPIAYNRIFTWKTGILRTRAGYIAPRHATCARPRSGWPTS